MGGGTPMKLYYSPGTCALGVHALMEEIGAPFEIQRIDFSKREQYSDAYLAISPKARVPALQRNDGTVLTEYQAISLYLGLIHPESLVVPRDAERQARMFEALEYIVGTIHANGFRRIFRPNYFVFHEADHEAAKAEGVRIVSEAFGVLDRNLAGKDWLIDDFSIADPALFFVSWWGAARVKLPLPPNVQKHYDRMMSRQSVQKALRDEGL
jgi:glutathione S-transferase